MNKIKFKKQEYSYGLIRFCEPKNISPHKIASLYVKEMGYEGNDYQDYIDRTWRKFAAFVNESILKGKIEGAKNISVSNGSEEYKQQKRILFNSYPEDLRNWFVILKGADI